MAKVQGGLFSVEGHGTLGGIITYQGRKTFNQAHVKATPTDPQTAGQRHRRTIFAALILQWQGLSEAEKQVYEDLRPQYNNNPAYNVFLTIMLASAQYKAKFGWVTFGQDAKFGGLG
jgi:hypothetical protein